jgi:putative ABC transport system permease protein
MSTLQLKILRDMWLFRARTVLAILAIAIGVGALGIMTTTLIILPRALGEGYAGTNPAHVILNASPVTEDLAEALSEVEGIGEAQARRSSSGRIQAGTRTIPLVLDTIPNFEALAISRLYLEDGALRPPPPGSIWLERSLRPVLGIQQGDQVEVRLANGTEEALLISGFVNDMSQLPATIQPVAYGYISDETAARLGQPATFNRLYVTIEGENLDRATVEHAVGEVREWLEDRESVVQTVRVPNPGEHPIQSNLRTVGMLLGTLGALTLLLSAFLVATIMSALVAQQVPQIGVLKALGGRTSLITQLYLRMVFIFGALALLLAVPMGVGGAYVQMLVLASTLNFDLRSFGLPPATVLLQVVGALLVPALAAFFPILQETRQTVRESLNSRGVVLGRRSQTLFSQLEEMPRLALLALRNTFRRSGRLVLAVGALSLAGAMFIAAFNVRHGFDRAAEMMGAETAYDVRIDFVESESAPHIEQIARAVPGVVAVESWPVAEARRLFPDGRASSSMILVGIPADTTMFQPVSRLGRRLQPGGGPELYANAETYAMLQPLALEGEIEARVNSQRDVVWRLAGVSLVRFVPTAYVLLDEFERITGQRDRVNRLVARTSRSDLETQESVAEALQFQFRERNIQVATAFTTAATREGIRAQLREVVTLLLASALLVAVVGGVGLASTMGINVLERSREIGVLRALGARRGLLWQLVVGEGIIITLLSILVGSLLAFPLTWLLDVVLGQTTYLQPLEFAYLPGAVAAWGGLLLVIAVVSCWLPARSAAQLPIREALTYE